MLQLIKRPKELKGMKATYKGSKDEYLYYNDLYVVNDDLYIHYKSSNAKTYPSYYIYVNNFKQYESGYNMLRHLNDYSRILKDLILKLFNDNNLRIL